MQEITPLDHQIFLAGGTTTAIERLPGQLQKAKAARQQSYMKLNLELIRENGRLRKEIAYHQSCEKSLRCFLETCLELSTHLQQAMETVDKEILKHEEQLLDCLKIKVDAANKDCGVV
jgi:hypothetical protein